MSNPRRKKKSTKALLCEEDLAAIRTSYRRSWTPILYTSADEDHKVKERYVRINDRRSRRRAKHAHMRRGEHASAGFEHCFKKRGQVGEAKESYDRLPPQAHSEILQEACETYEVDFDAQFPLSPNIHTSSGSSEAPSSEVFEEAFFREIENQDRKAYRLGFATDMTILIHVGTAHDAYQPNPSTSWVSLWRHAARSYGYYSNEIRN